MTKSQTQDGFACLNIFSLLISLSRSI